jgi:hypothetical protein
MRAVAWRVSGPVVPGGAVRRVGPRHGHRRGRRREAVSPFGHSEALMALNRHFGCHFVLVCARNSAISRGAYHQARIIPAKIRSSCAHPGTAVPQHASRTVALIRPAKTGHTSTGQPEHPEQLPENRLKIPGLAQDECCGPLLKPAATASPPGAASSPGAAWALAPTGLALVRCPAGRPEISG